MRDKFKAEDQSLTSEDRKINANRSVAKKVNINSRYGVICTTVNPRFQPTVTGMGRRSIQMVTARLNRLFGAEELYGDTDSCFTYIHGLNVFDMAKMTPQEVYSVLQFGNFEADFDNFKSTIYDKYYPVTDNNPQKIRGRVAELYKSCTKY